MSALFLAHAADWLAMVPVVGFVAWLVVKTWRDRRDAQGEERPRSDEERDEDERA